MPCHEIQVWSPAGKLIRRIQNQGQRTYALDLHPTEPGAIRITVRMINEAGFDQPYPGLQLTLTDRVGRVVGRRAFSPQHYLPQGTGNMIGKGELVSVVFDLARPHEKAVGFVVDILTEPA